MKEYFEDGSIFREVLIDGTEREFNKEGGLISEGRLALHKGERRRHGLWRFADEQGVVRRESTFEHASETQRSLLRSDVTGDVPGLATRCTGPVSETDGNDALMCGVWSFQDAMGQILSKVDLGRSVTCTDLAAHPVSQNRTSLKRLKAAVAGSNAESRLASFRIFGRGKRDDMRRAVNPCAQWQMVSRYGETRNNADSEVSVVEVLNSMLFGCPPGQALEHLAAAFFAMGRAQVALDLADAALRFAPSTYWPARIGYLRSTGREQEANSYAKLAEDCVTVEHERALLAIRRSPLDDVLHIEYAKLVRSLTPEHAQLIIFDCGEKESEARSMLIEALEARLPNGFWFKQIRRGFLDTPLLTLDAADFLTHSEWLFRAAPHAFQLTLNFATQHLAQLTQKPGLSRYTELSFWETQIDEDAATQLAQCSHLGGLEHLGLAATRMCDDGLRQITNNTAFPKLCSLDISHSRNLQHYEVASFITLKDAPFAPTLEMLALNHACLDERVLDTLAALPVLHHVEMEGCELGDEWGIALAKVQRDWTHLGLARCGIGDTGVQALAARSSSTLTSLDLTGNHVGDLGGDCLSKSTNTWPAAFPGTWGKPHDGHGRPGPSSIHNSQEPVLDCS